MSELLFGGKDLKVIIPSLAKPSNALDKLTPFGISHYASLSFITNLQNLQELDWLFTTPKVYPNLRLGLIEIIYNSYKHLKY
ncbi:hypothetical protein C1645_813580 [Glomus cerebriforme]|uniref:Uncharacterized protein n=1 Tax=Glomus cerebriforme TaxID=658196 RepID=A0A397TIT6_9GLOM|nr:hypothetical protein C1645_813580 [Glomus cerebriforme]